jgi:hypothetical protein
LRAKLEDPSSSLAVQVGLITKQLRLENVKNDLLSFIIMPVQRVPRYRMLLIELLNATNTNVPDHVAVSKALSAVAKVFL